MKLPQDIKSVRPTMFLAPPRMWERVYTTICTDIRKRSPASRRIFYGALGIGSPLFLCPETLFASHPDRKIQVC